MRAATVERGWWGDSQGGGDPPGPTLPAITRGAPAVLAERRNVPGEGRKKRVTEAAENSRLDSIHAKLRRNPSDFAPHPKEGVRRLRYVASTYDYSRSFDLLYR